MVELSSPVWQTLSEGREAAHRMQALLEGTAAVQPTLEALGAELSHQLSWYDATAYVLPHLAKLFPRLSMEEQVCCVVSMSAAIAAEAAWPLTPGTEAHREFQEGLTGLRPPMAALLTDPAVHALLRGGAAEEGSMFALGALAILGDRRHAYDLWWLSSSLWEMLSAACVCGWEEEELDCAEASCIQPAAPAPWDGTSLEREDVWLHGFLERVGDETLRPVLPLVYGMGVCPACGRREPYWSWLHRWQEEA